MGRNARKKPHRAGDGGQKHHTPHQAAAPMLPTDSTVPELHPGAFPTPIPSSEPCLVAANPVRSLYNYGFDEYGWRYFPEEVLEQIVIVYLHYLYEGVISGLVTLGYDDTLALRAVLCNGQYYGTMDPGFVIQKALAYLKTDAATGADDWNPPAGVFSDLCHLEEYSLTVMVCLLQQIRAEISRREALWCLLMNGLHLSRASSFELHFHSLPGSSEASSAAGIAFSSGAAFPFAVNGDSTGTKPAAASIHGAAGSIDSPPLLSSERKMQGRGSDQEVDEEAEGMVELLFKRLEAKRIEDENCKVKDLQEQMNELIMHLVGRVRELEAEVKATKEWAQQKVMQAAQKLSSNRNELSELRMEREEYHRVRAAAVVKKLETGNAEVRVEIEASKLSASESVTACMEVTLGEKEFPKKLVAWEKQKEKMQEEVTEEKEEDCTGASAVG